MRKADPALHEERRQQIMRAAVACFRRRGFVATTTAEICTEAGMSPGHLFHYFKCKEDIVAAVAAADRVQTIKVVRRLAESDDFVASVLDASREDADLGEFSIDASLSLELHAEAIRNPKVADAVSSNYRTLQEELSKAISAAQVRGSVDPSIDAVSAAIIVTALFDGIERAGASYPSLDRDAAGRAFALALQRFLSPSKTLQNDHSRVRIRRNR